MDQLRGSLGDNNRREDDALPPRPSYDQVAAMSQENAALYEQVRPLLSNWPYTFNDPTAPVTLWTRYPEVIVDHWRSVLAHEEWLYKAWQQALRDDRARTRRIVASSIPRWERYPYPGYPGSPGLPPMTQAAYHYMLKHAPDGELFSAKSIAEAEAAVRAARGGRKSKSVEAKSKFVKAGRRCKLDDATIGVVVELLEQGASLRAIARELTDMGTSITYQAIQYILRSRGIDYKSLAPKRGTMGDKSG